VNGGEQRPDDLSAGGVCELEASGEGNVLRSTAIVSSCTGLSRMLGFVREVLMGWYFGTSLAKSAFDVAFQIPNLFRRLFGEGALSAAFVPIFAETIEKDGHEAANRFAGKIVLMLGAVLGTIMLCGILAATVAMRFPIGERASAVMPLLRIMLPYMVFICMAALCMAILNSLRHFTVPAMTPVLLNVVWILILLIVCPRFGETPGERIYGVAWGILCAGALQLLFQVPVLRRFGFSPEVSFEWRDERVNRVLLAMGPVALGVGILQINVFVDRILALIVAEWAPAALTYAERLIYLPLGIFATALGTVLLPTFSRQAARNRKDHITETLATSLRSMFLVVIPACVGMLVLLTPIVRLAFLWRGGRFDNDSLVYTVRALAFYAPGLVVFSTYKILVPVFYALKDVRTPVRVASRVVFLNLALNVLFIMTWPAGFKHAGIAFATTVSSLVSCLVLGRMLGSRLGGIDWRGVLGCAARTILISVAMGLVVYLGHAWLAGKTASMGMREKVAQFIAVFGAIVTGVAVYAGLAFRVCGEESRAVVSALRRKS